MKQLNVIFRDKYVTMYYEEQDKNEATGERELIVYLGDEEPCIVYVESTMAEEVVYRTSEWFALDEGELKLAI